MMRRVQAHKIHHQSTCFLYSLTHSPTHNHNRMDMKPNSIRPSKIKFRAYIPFHAPSIYTPPHLLARFLANGVSYSIVSARLNPRITCMYEEGSKQNNVYVNKRTHERLSVQSSIHRSCVHPPIYRTMYLS